MTRGGLGQALAGSAALALVCLSAVPAGAETRTSFAQWEELGGPPRAYTTTVRLPGLGSPVAAVQSDSRGGQVGVQTGASTWFGPGTPPGEAYAGSRDQPYLNLRPSSDNAASPSTTTYTFERPTPSGWAFVLGDIDADEVTVSATLADGTPAGVEDLGFRGTFNACDTTPRPGGCPGPVPGDLPSWDPATATLTGNAEADDSAGASGWFEPTVPLASLTLTFRWRSGFPIYQTWFVSRTQSVTGTVTTATAQACDVAATRIRLLAADGTELATVRPEPDGSYAFDRVAATAGLSVTAEHGACGVRGEEAVELDLTDADGVADFRLVADEEPPAPPPDVVGQVDDEQGEPVPDVAVEIRDPDGDLVAEDTTDGSGAFDLGPVDPGDYTLSVEPPAGFEVVGPAQVPVSVTRDGRLLGDTDFVLRRTDQGPDGGTGPVAVPTMVPAGMP